MAVSVRGATEVFRVLGSSPLWETAQRSAEALENAGIPYAISGGVAVLLHGYRRTTADVDILVASGREREVKRALEGAGLVWRSRRREFVNEEDGTAVHLMFGGESASDNRSLGVALPEPEGSAVTEIEGLHVLSLARLIEAKLACGLGNLRRTHRDFADVVELVAANKLTKGFAGFLHKSVRAEFKELVDRARG